MKKMVMKVVMLMVLSSEWVDMCVCNWWRLVGFWWRVMGVWGRVRC